MCRLLFHLPMQRLMPTCSGNTVEPRILRFQSCYTTILHHRRQKAVRPAHDPDQERMLADIWSAGRLGADDREHAQRLSDGHGKERSWEGWKRIGLYVEGGKAEAEPPLIMEVELFRGVGELGLECLVSDRCYVGRSSSCIDSTGSRCMRTASTM